MSGTPHARRRSDVPGTPGTRPSDRLNAISDDVAIARAAAARLAAAIGPGSHPGDGSAAEQCIAATGLELTNAGQDGPVAAAVLVPLYLPAVDQPADTGKDPARSRAGGATDSLQRLRVVLTRRRSDLRNHAGEISCPGGRRDPDDLDLRDTALREAQEEIGLVRGDVIAVGELPPVSTFVTNYVIHPFVGLIPPGRRWTVSPREVDEVLDLSLIGVRDARTRTPMQRRGFMFETDAYAVGEHLIWGATARILEHLLGRLAPLLQPPERP